MISSPVVHRELNLVGFINVEFVNFVRPSVVSRSFRPSLEDVLNLHNNKSFRSTTKAARSSVIDISYLVDSQS